MFDFPGTRATSREDHRNLSGCSPMYFPLRECYVSSKVWHPDLAKGCGATRSQPPVVSKARLLRSARSAKQGASILLENLPPTLCPCVTKAGCRWVRSHSVLPCTPSCSVMCDIYIHVRRYESRHADGSSNSHRSHIVCVQNSLDSGPGSFRADRRSEVFASRKRDCKTG